MAYKPKVLEVVAGGTGLPSTFANQLLYSSSNNVIAELSNGTTGQLMTATTGSAPSWTTASGTGVGYFFFLVTGGGANPADSSTYFIPQGGLITSFTTSGHDARIQWMIPKAGTIKIAWGQIRVLGTLGSSENSTLSIRLNNTTDTTVTSTLKWDAATGGYSNTGLNIAVTAGDYIEIKLVTPAWATNPTNCSFGIQLFVEI